MPFSKNLPFNHWYSRLTSDFFEKRFIYLDLSVAEDVRGLPEEYAHGQDILGGRMRELNEQVKIAERRGSAVNALSDEKIKNYWGVQGLDFKKEMCEKKLEELKQPVSSHEEFRTALNDIGLFNGFLNKLKKPELDQADLQNFTNPETGFGAFYSDDLNKKIERTISRMTKRERVSNALIPQKSKRIFAKQAESDWRDEENKLKDELAQKIAVKASTEEIRNIEVCLEDKKYKIDWIARRIAQLEAEQEVSEENKANLAYLNTDEGKMLDKEIQEARKKQTEIDLATAGTTHKHTLRNESLNSILVGNLLDHESRLELTNIILQARAMKDERVKDYLNNHFAKTLDRFEKLKDKKPPRMNNKRVKVVEELLSFLDKEIIRHPDLCRKGKVINIKTSDDKVESFNCGIEALNIVENNIAQVDKILLNIEKSPTILDKESEKREISKAGIQRKVQNVKAIMALLTPERVDGLLARLDEDEKARIAEFQSGKKTEYAKTKYDNKFGESPEYQKKRKALEDLSNPNTGFYRIVKEAEAALEDYENLDPEEKTDIGNSLDRLQQILSIFSGEKIDKAIDPSKRNDSDIAQNVIRLLAHETDAEKIKKILDENLGSRHYQLLSDNQFESYTASDGKTRNLKEYTGGSMVFYERGDEWKILINKDVLGDGAKLQAQLTHELLHLQFEKNEELKTKWLELFTQNPEWGNIESVFIASFPNKKPPVGDKWRPEDILSEIFAMQNDISQQKNEKFKNIFQAVAATGITAKALSLPSGFFKDYEEARTAKEIESEFRGFEGAEDAGAKKGGSEAQSEGGSGSYSSYKHNIEKNSSEITRILGSEYIRYIPGSAKTLGMMKEYNDETAKLNEIFAKEKGSFLNYIIDERIKKVEEHMREIEKEMSKVSDKIPNTSMNPLRDIWNRSQFMSLEDILQVGTDIKEWWERRHKRRKADHAARIGSALFDRIPIPIASEFGIESSARMLKEEEAEVNEWKSRLAHKDAWELLELLHKLADEADPNKDMFKAVIRNLGDKGRINWRDPMLWRLLNKLQSAAPLPESGGSDPQGDDTLLKDPILLRQQLHKAFGEIWDYDEYLNLERTNGSNYSSGKEKYFGGFKKIQDQLPQRLEQLLNKKKDGGKVDPQEYEGIIDYSIKDGKCSAEACMFYLMVGVAEGIIYADRPLALDSEYVNNWPALQWIYNKKPTLTKKDYIDYIKTYFPNDAKKGSIGKEFKNFYWTEVNNDEMVISRVRKSVAERKWDHDWGRAIAVLGDANTAKQFLQGRSGQQETKDTAVENAYAGALQWLEENAKNPEKIDFQKHFMRQISWITMADGIIDRIVYDKGANDNFSRGNASLLSAIPREAGMGNHPNLNVGGQRSIIRDFLDRLDSPFFNMIRDEKSAKDDKEGLGIRVKNYLINKYPSLEKELGGVKEIDHIFDKMDFIIREIVYSHSPADFLKIIKEWLTFAQSQT